ncbi:hypothetical protein LINPERPRIM_LOCUS23852 [Linum perenne]
MRSLRFLPSNKCLSDVLGMQWSFEEGPNTIGEAKRRRGTQKSAQQRSSRLEKVSKL